MEQFKRAKVVMLPTNNYTIIFKDIINNKLYFSENIKGRWDTDREWFKNHNKTRYIAQHLYIISDDEIKKGDWYIYLKYNTIIQKKDYLPLKNDCKKIIATTDTSIIYRKGFPHNPIDGFADLPQLSQQFIDKYIKSYNKDKIITDVLVEYNKSHDSLDFGGVYIPSSLKINPKDNTITIKKIKNSWNKEEVISILNKLNNTLNIGSDLTLEQWIEKNL